MIFIDFDLEGGRYVLGSTGIGVFLPEEFSIIFLNNLGLLLTLVDYSNKNLGFCLFFDVSSNIYCSPKQSYVFKVLICSKRLLSLR
jgi:hypothetical protein